MKKLFYFFIASVLAMITCFGFVGCADNTMTLSQVLSGLGNNTGNYVIVGTADMIGVESGFHRTVELKYETNGKYSYSYTNNDNLHDIGSGSWEEEYFYQIESDGRHEYCRERDEGGLWYIYDPYLTTEGAFVNRLIEDANFNQFDASNFKEVNGAYQLKAPISLNPYWNYFLSSLTTMTITPNKYGAKIEFVASGDIGSSGIVTGTFVFNVTFGDSKLSKPSWAV